MGRTLWAGDGTKIGWSVRDTDGNPVANIVTVEFTFKLGSNAAFTRTSGIDAGASVAVQSLGYVTYHFQSGELQAGTMLAQGLVTLDDGTPLTIAPDPTAPEFDPASDCFLYTVKARLS